MTKNITEIIIISPLYIDLQRVRSKPKRVHLNLNAYRNLHYITSNEAKQAYKRIMRRRIEDLRIQTPVTITYQLYRPTKRIGDKMNVIAIVSKFLLDALTELNFWEDDNDNIIKDEVIKSSLYDKGNGRVEITIKSL